MTDDATVPTASKPRITQTGINRWREQAAAFFAQGESRAAVDAWLKSQGCPPRTREELLRQARSKGRGQHRRLGLRMLVIGLAICALGGVSLWLGVSGIPMGDRRRMHDARFVLLGALILVAGTIPVLFGLWKTLTGSAATLPSSDG